MQENYGPTDTAWCRVACAQLIKEISCTFLDASLHLYKGVCPFVRRSVCPSVHPSVRPSDCRSINPSVFPSIMVQKRAFSLLFVHVWVLRVLMCVRGWMPLPTRPQQYCDPPSLVFFIRTLHLKRNLSFCLSFFCPRRNINPMRTIIQSAVGVVVVVVVVMDF